MTGKLGDRPLKALERAIQSLGNQVRALPEASRGELTATLQEVSRAIAALRTAGGGPPTKAPDCPDAEDYPAPVTSILHNIFSAIPDLLTVIDRDFNIIMSNWHGPEFATEAARRGETKCYQVYHLRDRPCEDCHVQKVFATGKPQKGEKINEIDGRSLEFSVFPILDASGQAVLVTEHVRDITERHLAMEALRESEATLRTLIESNPESLFLLDTRGVILAASKVAAQRLDSSLEEIIGADAFALVSPEVGQKRFEIFQQVVATGQPRRFDDVRGDFHLDISMTPICSQDKVVQVAVLAVDLSGRKLAEAALRESEARFRAVFEFAPVGVGMADPTGRVLETNQALQALLGYNADELRAISVQEMTHPDDWPKTLQLQQELLAGRCQHYSLEKRYLRKDGGIVWAQVMVALLRDAQGEPQYLLATIIDRTGRKQAETELRESEQRFRLMAENIQDVFWIATPEIGHTLYVSPAFGPTWGRSCEEVYRDHKVFIDSIHTEDRERVKSEVLAGHRQGTPWNHEYRIIKPDGVVRWIHDRGYPVRDDQGRVILFTGVATDITARKALEEQLLQAQKMEAVGRLAGGVAHDFNNLLMAITGYGELMRGKVFKDDPLYSYLENILKAGDRATALTQQLLTFSRRQIVHPQVVDLNRVVLDLEPMLRRLIGEDLDLDVVTDRSLGAVKADPGQLGQIILNLVVNARDAMPQGGRLTLKTAPVNFTVGCHNRFGLTPLGAYVMLMVQDTGAGMDEATQAHAFEPFFTTKEPGKGTGLGLSTVYGIVKQSGGYLDLASQPGKGSTFTIYLPRLDAVAEPPKARIPITASFRGEATILLVEDEDVLRALLAKFMRLYGYTVLEARHGGEALLNCERHQGPIDLMVTDVVMPQMSGRELADRLRPLRPEMKILYMSGYTEDVLVQHGVADLSVTFLQKPFKPLELARRVHAVLHAPAG
jgi:two-component system, cell cycle sensor histidine kinase and response regulator CckA